MIIIIITTASSGYQTSGFWIKNLSISGAVLGFGYGEHACYFTCRMGRGGRVLVGQDADFSF